MHSFKAYGLSFASEFPMWGLPEADGPPDAEILFRPIDEAVATGQERGGRLVLAHIGGRLRFTIEDGRRIVLEKLGRVSDDELRGYLLGLMMATLLRQRGYVVLHACCMAREGQAIGFVGESGWGKSTLAQFFVQRGFTLLNDDVMAIRVDAEDSAARGPRSRPKEEAPVVIPGYPEIRLRAESGAFLREDFASLPTVLTHASKRRCTVPSVPEKPVPLARLFLLEPTYREDHAVLPLPAPQAVMELIAHTRVNNLIKSPAYAQAHMTRCAALQRQIPIVRLQRKRDLHALPQLFDLIVPDLAPTVTS